jgi:hypothetical protein
MRTAKKTALATVLGAAAIAAAMTPIYQERRQPGPKGKPAKDRSKAKTARKARKANRK